MCGFHINVLTFKLHTGAASKLVDLLLQMWIKKLRLKIIVLTQSYEEACLLWTSSLCTEVEDWERPVLDIKEGYSFG